MEDSDEEFEYGSDAEDASMEEAGSEGSSSGMDDDGIDGVITSVKVRMHDYNQRRQAVRRAIWGVRTQDVEKKLQHLPRRKGRQLSPLPASYMGRRSDSSA